MCAPRCKVAAQSKLRFVGEPRIEESGQSELKTLSIITRLDSSLELDAGSGRDEGGGGRGQLGASDHGHQPD